MPIPILEPHVDTEKYYEIIGPVFGSVEIKFQCVTGSPEDLWSSSSLSGQQPRDQIHVHMQVRQNGRALPFESYLG